MNPDSNHVLPSALCLQVLNAYLTPQQRDTLSACHAMRDQLLAVAATREEVLPVKLAWWQEELVRLADGHARHPVTQHMAATLDIDPATIELIREWLIAAQRDALDVPIESPTALRIDAFRRYGVALLLALSTDSEIAPSAVHVSYCALAMMLLDHTATATSAIDSNDMLAASTGELVTIQDAGSTLPLSILARLLHQSLGRLQKQKTLRPLRLTLTGWRAARQWHKRNPR